MTRKSRPELKADRGYLHAFAEVMKRIENSLAGATQRPVVVCVAGGAALHLYTGTRVSKDIDAKVMARFIPPDDLSVSYTDPDGNARLLYFDKQYNDAYGLLHGDAYDDAISIGVPGVDPKRLDVRLLSPLDLAVSKLSRFEAHDRDDIRDLAKAGLLAAMDLRRRAEAALAAYVGDVRRVRDSIAIAERIVADAQAAQ